VTKLRVGTGYDSHRFDDSRPLILGGVEIPNHPGLTGHSDGDALVHAVIDALLGAANEGNVGSHFPPSDDRWKGADSIVLLEAVRDFLCNLGWSIVNIDSTVVCEPPKIGPQAPAMRARLASAMGIEDGCVSIKGKTNETLGWIGRSEGLAVHAVALLERGGVAEATTRDVGASGS
jgi:2-C-methyl-D-erythritol 2,4-cyclodiphosphate synthase